MNIGFVGLGAMGAGIVPRLMAAGHAVTGWNRSKQKAEPLIAAGMRLAPTARGVGARRMPAAINGSAFCLLRFQPITAWPAAMSRGTMPAPWRRGRRNRCSCVHLAGAACPGRSAA